MIRIEAYNPNEDFDYYDDLMYLLDRYDNKVDMYTRDELGNDIIYRKLVKSVDEAEKFNYHSDYWGDADQYERDVVEFMEYLELLIGRGFTDEDGDAYEIEGLLIDKQYNSLGHCAVLLKKL